MKYRLILRKGAEADTSEACHWYEERVAGLGAEFIKASSEQCYIAFHTEYSLASVGK